MQNIKKRNQLLLNSVKKALLKRHFEAYVCENREEVISQIIKITSKEESFSWGGSITLDEVKIKDFLRDNNYKVFDRDKVKSPEEKKELILKGLMADNFLMSANAISEDGVIVNIDGHGNRLAALCYGPKNVIIVAGVNKIVKTVDDAYSRARNYAAPINAKRVSEFFEVETPCLKTGECMNCKSQTSICCQILATRLCFPKNRIKVILVNENLGY